MARSYFRELWGFALLFLWFRNIPSSSEEQGIGRFEHRKLGSIPEHGVALPEFGVMLVTGELAL
jgi:hypothetical protein